LLHAIAATPLFYCCRRHFFDYAVFAILISRAAIFTPPPFRLLVISL